MGKCVEKLDFGAELFGLKEEWDDLLRRSSRPTIYSTFDYVCTSCRHFKKDEEIFFLLFRDEPGGRLLAIFPLSVWNEKRRGITVRTVRHGVTTKYTDIDKPYPIIDQNHEEACWTRFRDYFRKDFREWEIIVYDELVVESYLNLGLGKLFRLPFYWTEAKRGPDSPIVRLDGVWEEFWGAHPNMRKKYRRIEKKIGDHFAYKVTGDPADIERCLNEYIAIEEAGYKAGQGVSRQEGLPFYRELFPRLAAKGQLYFGMMYDGDTVISAEISYVYLDRVYFALGTYNPEYSKLSPGTVSTSRFIQYFYGKGYVEGDFLAGFAHYINSWTSRIEKTTTVTIRRMGWVNGYLAVSHYGKRGISKLKRALTKLPQGEGPETKRRPVAGGNHVVG